MKSKLKLTLLMLVDPGHIDLTFIAVSIRLDLVGRNAETIAIEPVEPIATREPLFLWLEQCQRDRCDSPCQCQCANRQPAKGHA